MDLPIATVIIAMLTIQLLCFGALTFLMDARLEQDVGMNEVGWCTVALSLSYMLQLASPTPGFNVTNLINHSLALLGSLFLLTGVLRFIERPFPKRRWLLALTAAYTLLQLLVEAFTDSSGRYVLLSALSALVYGMLSANAWLASGSSRMRYELHALAVICTGFALLHLLKAHYVLRDGLPALAMDNWHQTVFYLYMAVMAVVMMPLMIWMVFSRLTVRLKEAALRDTLTGALNRRGMWQHLHKVFGASRPPQCILLLIDLDHFKQINDAHGHQIGDEVLRAVARTLTDSLQGKNFLARIGGEEFVVSCFHCSPEQATEHAETLREQVQALSIPLPSGQPLQVTLTVGVSPPIHAYEHIDRALQAADAALYSGKNEGRNRVTGGIHRRAYRTGLRAEANGSDISSAPNSSNHG